jgi:hypothetical protein
LQLFVHHAVLVGWAFPTLIVLTDKNTILLHDTQASTYWVGANWTYFKAKQASLCPNMVYNAIGANTVHSPSIMLGWTCIGNLFVFYHGYHGREVLELELFCRLKYA